MAVYTAYEMIADCQAGKPAGWVYFVRQFVPPLRWLLARYGQGEDALRARIKALQAPGGMAGFKPTGQREWLGELRPEPVVAPGAEPPFDLAALSEALAETPALERQNLWFDTMGYDVELTAKLLRQTAETARGARERGMEALRGKLDSWSLTMLRDHGPVLGAVARAAKPAEVIPFRVYLDVIDGRATWQTRAEVDRAMLQHWYEVDQFCRVREADAAVTETRPYTEEDDAGAARPYYELLGVTPPRPPRGLFKRLFVGRAPAQR
ncbi:MAG: hypothetical protein IT162_19735 [Bryobacterales bacterium]|nr:hypothetical protein [Bryobacterales bacterium]